MLNYNDSGRGEVVVLLHGFCESNAIWHAFETQLSQNYRVICPDFPGFGGSLLQQDSLTMEVLAAEIKALIDDLNVKKCVLIGHSLGGYVTLAFADLYPEYLKGFGLFHSSAFPDTDQKKENRNKTVDFLEENGIEKFATSFVPPLFSLKTKSLYKDEIDRITQIAASSNVLAVIEAAKGMRDRPDRTHVLKGAKVPVLFICGKNDGAVPLESSLSQVALAADSKVHFLDKVGHMGMVEARDKTLVTVEDFVNYCLKN